MLGYLKCLIAVAFAGIVIAYASLISCAPDTRVHARSLQGCLARMFPPHFPHFERSGALLKPLTRCCKNAK